MTDAPSSHVEDTPTASVSPERSPLQLAYSATSPEIMEKGAGGRPGNRQ